MCVELRGISVRSVSERERETHRLVYMYVLKKEVDLLRKRHGHQRLKNFINYVVHNRTGAANDREYARVLHAARPYVQLVHLDEEWVNSGRQRTILLVLLERT